MLDGQRTRRTVRTCTLINNSGGRRKDANRHSSSGIRSMPPPLLLIPPPIDAVAHLPYPARRVRDKTQVQPWATLAVDPLPEFAGLKDRGWRPCWGVLEACGRSAIRAVPCLPPVSFTVIVPVSWVVLANVGRRPHGVSLSTYNGGRVSNSVALSVCLPPTTKGAIDQGRYGRPLTLRRWGMRVRNGLLEMGDWMAGYPHLTVGMEPRQPGPCLIGALWPDGWGRKGVCGREMRWKPR